MANRFTADNHFGHENVIKYCARPFSCAEEMDEAMKDRWNAVVAKEDTVWHIGDFSLGAKALSIVRHLNGKINLVPGNHDACFPKHRKHKNQVKKYLDAGFAEIFLTAPLFEFFDGTKAFLWHLPYMPNPVPTDYDVRYPEWRLEDKGQFLVHGHVHEHWLKRGRMVNVGVDRHDFTPVTEERVLELLYTSEVNL